MIGIILLIIILAGILPLSLYIVKTLRENPDISSETLDSAFIRGMGRKNSQEWWESRRGKFNRGLIVSGFLALTLQAILIQVLKPGGFVISEFSILSLPLIAASYLVYMGALNLFYNIGPISESIMPSIKDIENYRKRLFNIGYWLSSAIPFLIPFWFFITNWKK